MRDADALHRVVDVIGEIGDRHVLGFLRRRAGTRHGGDLDHAADVAQRVELLVVDVARMVAQRADAGMRGDDRRARAVAPPAACVSRETCATSTSMPSRFSSAIAARPSAERPPCSPAASPRSGARDGAVAERVVAVMGQREIARAERAEAREPARGRCRRRSRSPRGHDRPGRRRAAPPRSRRRCGTARAPLAVRPMARIASSMAMARAKAASPSPACAGPAAHRRQSSRRRCRRAASSAGRRAAWRRRTGRAVRPGDVDMGVEGEEAAVQRERVGHADGRVAAASRQVDRLPSAHPFVYFPITAGSY